MPNMRHIYYTQQTKYDSQNERIYNNYNLLWSQIYIGNQRKSKQLILTETSMKPKKITIIETRLYLNTSQISPNLIEFKMFLV